MFTFYVSLTGCRPFSSCLGHPDKQWCVRVMPEGTTEKKKKRKEKKKKRVIRGQTLLVQVTLVKASFAESFQSMIICIACMSNPMTSVGEFPLTLSLSLSLSLFLKTCSESVHVVLSRGNLFVSFLKCSFTFCFLSLFSFSFSCLNLLRCSFCLCFDLSCTVRKKVACALFGRGLSQLPESLRVAQPSDMVSLSLSLSLSLLI